MSDLLAPHQGAQQKGAKSPRGRKLQLILTISPLFTEVETQPTNKYFHALAMTSMNPA